MNFEAVFAIVEGLKNLEMQQATMAWEVLHGISVLFKDRNLWGVRGVYNFMFSQKSSKISNYILWMLPVPPPHEYFQHKKKLTRWCESFS